MQIETDSEAEYVPRSQPSSPSKSRRGSGVQSKLFVPTTAQIAGQWIPTDKPQENVWVPSGASSTTPHNSREDLSPSKMYEDVPSRLFEPTTATIAGRATEVEHSKENVWLPSGVSSAPSLSMDDFEVSKKYKDVPSKLYEPTTATIAGRATEVVHHEEENKWTSTRSPISGGFPELTGELSPTKKYSDVQSRLYEPTTAAIASRAPEVVPHEEEKKWNINVATSSTFPEAPPCELSPTRKYQDVPSKLFEPTTAAIASRAPEVIHHEEKKWALNTSNNGAFPDVSGELSPTKKYQDVQSRLYEPTAAAIASRAPEVVVHHEEKKWTLNTSSNAAFPDAPQGELSPSKRYQDVQPRLYEPTTATIAGRAPEIHHEEEKKWVLNTSNSGVFPDAPASELSPSKRYQNVASKLFEPTTATIAGRAQEVHHEEEKVWAVNSATATVPEPSIVTNKKFQDVPSKLMSPTTASIHARAGKQEEEEEVKYSPIPSPVNKKFQDVPSKLMSPTTASVHARAGKNEEEAKPKLIVTPTESQIANNKKFQSVQSKLFSPTSASTHGKAEKFQAAPPEEVVVGVLNLATKKHAEVNSRLHIPTSASIHGRADATKGAKTVKPQVSRTQTTRPATTSSVTTSKKPLSATTTTAASTSVSAKSQPSRVSKPVATTTTLTKKPSTAPSVSSASRTKQTEEKSSEEPPATATISVTPSVSTTTSSRPIKAVAPREVPKKLPVPNPTTSRLNASERTPTTTPTPSSKSIRSVRSTGSETGSKVAVSKPGEKSIPKKVGSSSANTTPVLKKNTKAPVTKPSTTTSNSKVSTESNETTIATAITALTDNLIVIADADLKPEELNFKDEVREQSPASSNQMDQLLGIDQEETF